MRIAVLLFSIAASSGAADFDMRRIDDPALFAVLSSVARLSFQRFDHSEAAAFIIDAGDHIDCVLWPQKFAYDETRFDGDMPEHTLAIVHSHPDFFVKTQPSVHDVEQAQRLALPMFVVARFSAYVVDPASGEIVTLGDHIKWPVRGASVCREMPQITARRR